MPSATSQVQRAGLLTTHTGGYVLLKKKTRRGGKPESSAALGLY